MFVPEIYRVTDDALLSQTIRDYPLAIMVTNGDEVPFATHLAIIAESAVPSRVGATLLGHMNRANPHWRALSSGMAVRLIFTGPNGYVTPAVYGVTPAAPTWNFVSVHVRGTLELLAGTEEALHVVGRTIEAYEGAFGKGWSPEGSHDYHRRISGGVGPFRVTVTGVDGQFKLSQEKEDDLKDRVIDGFAGSQRGTDRDLADIMRKGVRA